MNYKKNSKNIKKRIIGNSRAKTDSTVLNALSSTNKVSGFTPVFSHKKRKNTNLRLPQPIMEKIIIGKSNKFKIMHN